MSPSLMVVDSEEEFDWTAPLDPKSTKVEAIDEI